MRAAMFALPSFRPTACSRSPNAPRRSLWLAGAHRHGHGTDRAILLGLSEKSQTASIPQPSTRSWPKFARPARCRSSARNTLVSRGHRPSLSSRHHVPSRIRDAASQRHDVCRLRPPGDVLLAQIYFSIGGGFIVTDREPAPGSTHPRRRCPIPSAARPSCWPRRQKIISPSQHLMLANETRADQMATRRSRSTQASPAIWQAMQDCCARGMVTDGILPGGLNVRRRAKRLVERLARKRSQ